MDPTMPEQLEPGDWVLVGDLETVVCTVYSEADPPGAEVVYIDWKKKATNADIVWQDGEWQFSGQSGGYADQYPRLAEFVAILRRGPHDPSAKGPGARPIPRPGD